MVKAVLFGSLSALTDLTDLERAAFNSLSAEQGFGFNWTPEAYRSLTRRKGRFAAVRELELALQGADPLPHLIAIEHRLRDLLDSSTLRPDPWLADALPTLRKKNMRIGLVTGAFRQTSNRLLANLFRSRASSVFDVVTAFEDGAAQKPDPALYTLALERLNVRPDNAIAFDITPEGIAAAQAAGLYTIALPRDTVHPKTQSSADDHCAETIATTLSRHRGRTLGHNTDARPRVPRPNRAA